MLWKLFLDDDRYPVDNTWVIARNFDDACWYVTNYGLPTHMSLDHDMGYGCYTGMDFIRWYCGYIIDNGLKIDPNFSFYVHSMNPVGAKNIQAYYDNFVEMYDT